MSGEATNGPWIWHRPVICEDCVDGFGAGLHCPRVCGECGTKWPCSVEWLAADHEMVPR